MNQMIAVDLNGIGAKANQKRRVLRTRVEWVGCRIRTLNAGERNAKTTRRNHRDQGWYPNTYMDPVAPSLLVRPNDLRPLFHGDVGWHRSELNGLFL